jgi:SAM-dependent methyltransferase
MVVIGQRQPLQQAGKWRRRKMRHVKRRVSTIVIASDRRYAGVRNRLADQYLAGHGLELGALQLPLRVPSGAVVRYVDRLPVPQLREHYPELDDYDLVAPDIIDDGESLASIPDASVDFVIANHMIEHCEDPIGTLKSHLRVLRPGGVIYMAVPDCRFTFDRNRPLTSLSHLKRDHLAGPAVSRREHYQEWAHYLERVSLDEVAQRADDLERQHYSIHFHVWTPVTFLELLTAGRHDFGLPLEVDALERNGHEFIVIIRRAHDGSPASKWPDVSGRRSRSGAWSRFRAGRR